MNKIKLAVIVGSFVCLGSVSQIVEKTVDKAAVKEYVTTHFEEQDGADEQIDFESDEGKENNFIEWLGF